MAHFRKSTFCLLAMWFTICFAPSVPRAQTADGCTDEDYAIFSAVLNDFASIRKIDRLLLRDHTQTRFVTSARNDAPYVQGVPADVSLNFDARNKTHQKIDVRHLRPRYEIVSISPAVESRILQTDEGCSDKEPMVTLSLPGVADDHTLALIMIGKTCSRESEHNSLLLLQKMGSTWKVQSRLMQSHVIYDYFSDAR